MTTSSFRSAPPRTRLDLARDRHVVVMATAGRLDTLPRALSSIAAQSLAPSAMVIAVDGDDALVTAVGGLLAALPWSVDTTVLRNDRTPGASGAWNTALDRATRAAEDPRATVVSFLDDDDAWEPDHLAIVDDATRAGAEVVATPILRFDPMSPEGALVLPPPRLVAADFLVGNPGVQGSNLSARLAILLEAGCFDEALRACTDRDLCIRLADLGAAYHAGSAGRVHHHATGAGRLSVPMSAAKLDGLDVFLAKYAFRMTHAEREAFEARATRVFGWSPRPTAFEGASAERASCPRSTAHLALAVGVIVDTDAAQGPIPLLEGLARLQRHPRVDALRLLVLGNGAPDGLAALVASARAAGIDATGVEQGAYAALAERQGLAVDAAELGPRKSIAVARSLLQCALHDAVRETPGAVAWVVDEDVRVPRDVDLFVDDVVRAREAGLDVAIGMVAGVPPIPAAATLRTQLVDLANFLHGARARHPDEPVPNWHEHSARWRHARRDYYYDLTRRETDRLETPFMPYERGPTVRDTVRRVAARAERLLAGEQIFRPVLASGEDPIEAATPSCLRGGNTFIFDTDLLLVPNLSPKVASRRLRRSDMMWAAVARFELGKRVAQLPIYVEHDRAREPARGLDADKLFDDVVGYAFFRAAELALAAPEGAAALCDDAVRARVVATAAKYARERVAELRMSAFRARGAAVTIERLLESSVLPGLDEAGATSLRTLCARVALELDDDAIRGLALRIRAAFDDPGFDVFLRQLVVDARVWRARRVAEARTARPMGALLGLGAEGVVFRTGDRFVKVLDGWSEIDRERAVPVLHHLATRPATAALPRVLCVDDSAPPVVLQADFTPSEPVVRPEAAEVVALLRALRRAGWAMTNLKADNLRRTDRGLRVIDLGRSIVPWSAENERTMAREAWLLLHHHHHDVDLPALVRRSRTRDDLPELVGVDALVAAVRDDPKQRLDEAIAHAVERLAPRSVLDFGCGKPRAWQRLANGRRFVAFDPDSRLRSRWTAEAPSVAFVDGVDALDGDPFEAAICSLVLCSLDDGDARTALHRLRSVLRPGSAAIVAVCDPRAVHVPRTARHGRCVPEGARYADHFAYAKQVDDGGVRVEHHRPLEDNIAMITACGFRVCSQSTIEGVDLATWKSAPEFVVLELEATPFQAVARRRAPLSGLTTICYHRVSDAERSGGPRLDAWRKRGMVVSTSTFHQHLGDASRLFELVRLVDVVRAAERGDALPRRSLLVTFDDGYRDVVDTIAPALERFDVPATFFVRRPTTDGFPTWAPLDLLYAALGSVAPGPHRSPPTGPSREGLLERPIQEQLGVVAAEVRRHGMDVRDLDRATVYASARDLEALRARGHSLGAHGVEHVRWTTLPDDELGAAARACARWMATLDATTFAYPDAALSRRTTRALARAGFALGFGLEAPAPLGVLKALALERVVARDEVLQIEAIARSAEEER